MFRTGLVATWITWKNFGRPSVFAHPIIAVVLAFVILAFVVRVPYLKPFVLHRLGFRESGARCGEMAT